MLRKKDPGTIILSFIQQQMNTLQHSIEINNVIDRGLRLDPTNDIIKVIGVRIRVIILTVGG
jgi:hypothetical protein